MEFSEALKSQVTPSIKIHTIQSSWETEYGREITETDWTNLHKFFSLNEIYSNVQKVTNFEKKRDQKYNFFSMGLEH